MSQPGDHGSAEAGEGEALMDAMAMAPPSHSSLYLSLPLGDNPCPPPPPPPSHGYLSILSSSSSQQPQKPAEEATLVMGVRPSPCLRSRRNTVILATLVALLVMIFAVVIPIAAVIVRSRDAREAEARRIFGIRAFAHRSTFHFQPAKNWMNDPNGPMYYQGYYHLFYQYNPDGAVWGHIVWGHAVSTDLVNWRHLEPALQGDQWYDVQGIWSGSATFAADGTPLLMYTGWSVASLQTQNIAIPANGSDPLLRHWVKVPENPFALAPEGYNGSQFRDPTTAWQGADGVWRLLVGANAGPGGTTGTALLFKSFDLRTWAFNRSLHSVPATGMWECPDFYPVPASGAVLGAATSSHGPAVKHVLKISANDKNHDYYAVGTYVAADDAFVPESPGLDAGLGLRYDYGKFYASKSFFDQHKNRRILFGWVNESDTREADIRKGWASVMAMPREVWLDERTTTDLVMWPVEELQGLRAAHSSLDNVTLGAGSVVRLDDVAGSQLDIEVSFEMPNLTRGAPQPPELVAESGQLACSQRGPKGVGPFGVLVLATDDFREQTAISLQVLQPPGEGWKVLVCSDQSRSSVGPDLDMTPFGSFVRVYETDELLTLRILVDHSIVETFVQGGRTVITSRVYPELALDKAARVFLFNNGTELITARKVDVWNMNAVQITPLN